MLKPDIVRLQHMVDAANDAISFVAGKSKTELETDRALALALVNFLIRTRSGSDRVLDSTWQMKLRSTIRKDGQNPTRVLAPGRYRSRF